MKGLLDISGSWGEYNGYSRLVFTGDPRVANMCFRISRLGHWNNRQWIVTDQTDLRYVKSFQYHYDLDKAAEDAYWPWLGGILTARGHFRIRDSRRYFQLIVSKDRKDLLTYIWNMHPVGLIKNNQWCIWSQTECDEIQKLIESNPIDIYGIASDEFSNWQKLVNMKEIKESQDNTDPNSYTR